MWKQLFHATWKTYKSRFDPLIENIQGHSRLVHQQASLAQIEDFRRQRTTQDLQLQTLLETQQAQQLREIYLWLRPHNVENDQHSYSEIRGEFPGTGQWILNKQCLKEWMDPQFPTIPPLLWMSGIPGAGK